MKFENVRGSSKIAATKAQLREALYLLLDERLPKMDCKLIEQRGNYMCDVRCDECMYNQLLWRVKHGEKSKKTRLHEKREKQNAENYISPEEQDEVNKVLGAYDNFISEHPEYYQGESNDQKT